ncbi:hypothetical protein ACF0H5_006157 [Mactra antiquata]
MRWISLLLMGGLLITVTLSSEDLPTYFIHERCGQSINLRRESVFMARVELLPVSSTTGEPCIFNIESWSFQNRLMVNFEEISTLSDKRCSQNILEIYDGPSEESPKLNGLQNLPCDKSKSDEIYNSLATTDVHLTFRYHRNTSSMFRATVVAFHEGPCRSFEHQCLNGRCIMNELVCNGYNPCGDFSDCLTTLPPEEVHVSESSHVTIVVIVSTSATLVVMVICAIVLFKCYQLRKKHRRLHRHNEYLVTNQRPVYSPPTSNNTSPHPAYDRTVSQLERDLRYAPPSYSQLPVVDPVPEVESSDSDDNGDTDHERRIEILPLQECLDIGENNPPSYACVMLHQDAFHVSELNINSLFKENGDSPKSIESKEQFFVDET